MKTHPGYGTVNGPGGEDNFRVYVRWISASARARSCKMLINIQRASSAISKTNYESNGIASLIDEYLIK